MAIPWLIGAAVLGIVGAALSDDSSSNDSSSSRELEREREKAESERKEKIAQAEREAKERKITEQNRAHAQRVINKYALPLSPNALISLPKKSISAVAGLNLKPSAEQMESVATKAYQASEKSIKRAQQIELISKQLEEIKQLENDLMNL